MRGLAQARREAVAESHAGASMSRERPRRSRREALAGPLAHQLHQARTRIAELCSAPARAHEMVSAFDEFEPLVGGARGRELGVRWDPLESTCRHASLSIL